MADSKHIFDKWESLRRITYCWKPAEILNNGLKVAEISTESSQTRRYEHKSAQSQALLSPLLQRLRDVHLLSKELGINYIFPQNHWMAARPLQTWSEERSRALEELGLPTGVTLRSPHPLGTDTLALSCGLARALSIICTRPRFQYCFFASVVRQIYSLRCQSQPQASAKEKACTEWGREDRRPCLPLWQLLVVISAQTFCKCIPSSEGWWDGARDKVWI